jgi:hypothetical protein
MFSRGKSERIQEILPIAICAEKEKIPTGTRN